MLCGFFRVLGIVFSFIGVVSIIVALDRLVLRKAAYKMVLFIESGNKESERIA